MSYNVKFDGVFRFNKPLTVQQFTELNNFAKERHDRDSFTDYYCQWVPTEDGTGLEWDKGEKFGSYVEWLEYLIQHFFEPWGIVLNGSVRWRGEEFDDLGVIEVKDNQISARSAP